MNDAIKVELLSKAHNQLDWRLQFKDGTGKFKGNGRELYNEMLQSRELDSPRFEGCDGWESTTEHAQVKSEETGFDHRTYDETGTVSCGNGFNYLIGTSGKGFMWQGQGVDITSLENRYIAYRRALQEKAEADDEKCHPRLWFELFNDPWGKTFDDHIVALEKYCPTLHTLVQRPDTRDLFAYFKAVLEFCTRSHAHLYWVRGGPTNDITCVVF